MKLVFCGTPHFAVPTLNAVLAAGHEVALVVSQPDRPVGRSAVLTSPPIKTSALEKNLRVVQPEKIRNNLEFRAELSALVPDAILIVAYGRIIPPWMLDLPRYGNLNLHGSLLPKYRGAAPIQWAIAHGETRTGVTTMRIDEGLDTGDILLQREIGIAANATSEDIYPILADAGAALMVKTLTALENGTIIPHKQDNAASSLAPILSREDAKVDFSSSASTLYNRWRAFQPWPGAYTFLSGRKLALHQLRPASMQIEDQAPGTLLVDANQCFVACGEHSWIELIEVQAEGKKRLSFQDFLRGSGLKSGMVLG